METNSLSLKSLLFVSVVSLLFLGVYSFTRHISFPSGVVFCDVGQGDGAYIRLLDGTDIVIDAGPANGQMSSCLERYMPFNDTDIEYAFLSHSQIDHYGGFLGIMKHYRIKTILMPPVRGTGKQFGEFETDLKKLGVRILTPVKGQHLMFSTARFDILWPPSDYLETHILRSNGDMFGMPVGDDNMLSLVLSVTFPSRTYLFTGDAPVEIMRQISTLPFLKHAVLKMPHHGSKTGMNQSILKTLSPFRAIISVGRNNPYGHPSKEVIGMLQKTHIPYERTDVDGTVAFPED